MNTSFIQEKSVSTKIWGLFAATAVSLFLTLGIVYIQLSNVVEIINDTKTVRMITDELSQLGENLLDLETGQRGFLLTQNTSYLKPYKASQAVINQRVKRLNQLVEDKEIKENLKLMTPVIVAKQLIAAETIKHAQQGNINQALDIVKSGKGQSLMDKFRHLRTNMLVRQTAILNQHKAKYERELTYAIATLLIGGLTLLVIMYVSASTTTKRLKKPILNLLDGIKAMEEGRLDFKVQISEKDEIGRISSAFNEMAEHIFESRRLREETLAELQRSNADLDKFAYVASHDLKAPLRGIRSLAQWIEEDVAATASEDTIENLNLLNSRVDRLDGLLESLLAYSRISHKKAQLENLNIVQFIDEIGDYLAPPSGFQIKYQGYISDIITAKAPLELVLRNLINNAIKHHDKPNGNIIISTRDVGNVVEFRVEDDGPGIPSEFYQRIFEMFQTLKPRDEVEGSGMGLAIVKKTIEHFGGLIHVEPSTSNRGSLFIFTWKK